MNEIENFLNPESKVPESYENKNFKKALIRVLDNINNSIITLNNTIVRTRFDMYRQIKKLRRDIKPKFRGFK